MKAMVIYLAALAFNAAVLAGTGYVVFWKGESGWWFLFALLCCVSASINAKDISA